MSTITRDIANLGIGFFLMFTAINSAAYIIAVLFKQIGYNDLGLYVIFVNAFFCMIGGVVAPYFGNKFSSKLLMTISMSCYAFKLSTYIVINFVHAFWVVYPLVMAAGAVSGFTACFMWMAQGEYVHTRCQKQGKQAQKGFYFGLFYRIYSASNVSAGVITTFFLGLFEAYIYFIVLASVAVSSVLYVSLFVPSVSLPSNDKIPITPFEIQAEQQAEAIKNKQKKFKISMIFRFYPKMASMLSFVGLVGFIMGFYNSSLGQLIESTLPETDDKKFINMRIGIGFILMGVGQILGGIISGRQADRIHIQTIGGIGITLYLITCQTTMIQTQTLSQVFVYFVSFCWGFIHSYIQNWIIICCSRNYKGKAESFIINKQFHFLTLCLYQIIVIFGTKNIPIVLTFLTFLTVPCIVSLTQLKPEEQHKLEM